MALSDSAVHMIGADYLIHHGQSYGHLDLRSSYGQFINDYYDTGYPSGADTLFGGSALLLRAAADLGLPAVQRASCSRLAAGPALGARPPDAGCAGAWAALAAFTAMRAGARLRLRADRLGQGDHRALDAAHARLPRRRAPALAARAAARRGSRSRSCSPPASPRSGSPSACGRSRRSPCCSWSLVQELRARGRIGAPGAWAALSPAALVLLLAAWPTLAAPLAVAAASRRASPRRATPATCMSRSRIQVFGVWLRAATSSSRPGAAALCHVRADRASCSLAAVLGALQLLRTARASRSPAGSR